MVVREKQQMKGIQIGKGDIKLSQFADDMILYIENPKDATRKLLKLQDTKLTHTFLASVH